MLSTILKGLSFRQWNLGSGAEYNFATFSNSDDTMLYEKISDNMIGIITNSSDFSDFCDEFDWIVDSLEGVLIDNLLVITDDNEAVIFKEYALNCWSSVYQMIIGDRASVEDYWYEHFVPEEEEEFYENN